MTHVVMITGAAGSGKSYMANAIMNQMPSHVTCARYSIKQPLRAMLWAFASNIEGSDSLSTDDEEYARMKNTFYQGKTGREWQILWGSAMRGHNKDVLSRITMGCIEREAPDFAIIDDMGFADEYDYFHSAVQSRMHLTIIYLSPRDVDGDPYSHLDQFKNDSRQSLSGYADLANPDMRRVIERLDAVWKLSN